MTVIAVGAATTNLLAFRFLGVQVFSWILFVDMLRTVDRIVLIVVDWSILPFRFLIMWICGRLAVMYILLLKLEVKNFAQVNRNKIRSTSQSRFRDTLAKPEGAGS